MGWFVLGCVIEMALDDRSEEYYEGYEFWEDRKPHRKRLLNNFFEWDEFEKLFGMPH